MTFDSYGRLSETNRMPVTMRGSGVELAKDLAVLAPGASTDEVSGVVGGDYVGAFQFDGNAPALAVEYLAPDGDTFLTAATLPAGGLADVRVGNNATIRLTNAGVNPILNLSASLT